MKGGYPLRFMLNNRRFVLVRNGQKYTKLAHSYNGKNYLCMVLKDGASEPTSLHGQSYIKPILEAA